MTERLTEKRISNAPARKGLRKVPTLIGAVVLGCLLGACGIKGPLYLPQQKGAAEKGVSTPTGAASTATESPAVPAAARESEE